MSVSQQRRLIAVMGILTVSMYFIAHADEGLPKARALIGIGGIFTIISVFTDLGLQIGAAMAVVIGITATLTEGDKVLGVLTQRSTPTTLPTPTRATGRAVLRSATNFANTLTPRRGH